MKLENLSIDESWALFLDRDGVINKRLIDDYVKTVDDFVFLPGASDAIALFSCIFRYIFVVTNQQGIGKGLMSDSDLGSIHNKMVQEVTDNNGRIDKIYYCPHKREDKSKYRKPQIGMALHAKKDFPAISFRKSIMVGDTINDMKFGKNAGMHTVLISDDTALARENVNLIDFRFHSLGSFADSLKNHLPKNKI